MNKTQIKKQKHWNIVDRDGWPTIQAKRQDLPFILFANDTALGERAAYKWAEIICDWMNECMRLGLSTERYRNRDVMLRVELRKACAEMDKLKIENQSLHHRLMNLNHAHVRAMSELRQATQKEAKL